MIHPARQLSYDDLLSGLEAAKREGSVAEAPNRDGLRLFCYTKQAVYDRMWNPFSMMARGLILDDVRKEVVATPFPKFFNVGEGDTTIPDLPFETFEKLDGSLIIIFHHDGQWKTATKGSLYSDQARWARDHLNRFDLSSLVPGDTYLAEGIYPENRIVVTYDYEGLVLLAAYDAQGYELTYDEVLRTATALGGRAAERHSFQSVSDLIAHTGTLSANEEGFVLRFSNGLRLKVKGEEYRRIHALISRCTPLAMWEAMKDDIDLDDLRRQLPEEFWVDFDSITLILSDQLAALTTKIAEAVLGVQHLSDKEVGLMLNNFSKDVRRFVFPYRNGKLLKGTLRDALFREIRPTGNVLTGYRPSYAMNRVMDE